MKRALWLVMLVAATAFAGCLGGDDKVDAEDDGLQDRPEDAVVTATTGSIKGTVASDLFEPLAGAVVSIVETGVETTVARNGEFVFNDVDPGRFVLVATALGYAQAQRAVEVKAGEVSQIGFQLVPVPSDDPYVEEREHTAIINMGAAWTLDAPVVGCQNIEPGDDVLQFNPDSCGQLSFGANTQPEFGVTEDVKTMLVEMVWSPAGPLGEHLKMDLVCPLVPRGFLGQIQDEEHVCFFDTPSRESPVIHRVDEEHWVENDYNFTGVWVGRVFPSYGTLGTYDLIGVDAGVTYEQQFTVFISVFHKERAPEGYSAIPDV